MSARTASYDQVARLRKTPPSLGEAFGPEPSGDLAIPFGGPRAKNLIQNRPALEIHFLARARARVCTHGHVFNIPATEGREDVGTGN